VIVDYERAWVELKAHLLSKNSHGQRDLLTEMAKIETGCRVPEDQRGYDPDPPYSKPATRALREVTRHG
jgi:hypothetical protein